MSKDFNLKIENDEHHFEIAIDLLMDDIIKAINFNNLLKDLINELKENEKVYNESRTFWYLTIESLKDSRMIRLCRIFDTEKSSISLPNFLDTLKEHSHFYLIENFKERMKGNPFVDSLSKKDRTLDLEELDLKIEKIKKDKTVKKITIYRNNLIAHKSLRSGIKDFKILKENPIEIEEIDNILIFCRETINQYMNLFKSTTWSPTIVGSDDFKSLIKFTSIGLQKYKNDLQKEIDKYKKE